MACYHPLRAFNTGLLTDSFKPKYKICGSDVDRIHAPYSYMRNGLQRSNKQVWQDKWITEWIPIPCGQCIGCRIDYSRMWADRCILEAKGYEHNAFITLTYDPEHLPKPTPVVDTQTGEVLEWSSLMPEHLQKFMKDLRRFYKYHYNHDGIRFYACGEYGDEGGRPHYHLLVFNLPVPDKVYWFTNNDHENIYVSDSISQIWGKGIVTIGEVTWNSAAYVARYVVKKQKGDTKGLVELPGKILVKGILPEYTVMSRKPGIAYKYYDENKHQFYENDEIVISVRGKARTIKPPRYFDKLYDIDCEDPFLMQDIKRKRAESARNSMKLQLERTSLNEQEYLVVKERNKIGQISALKRNLKSC